jgi:hypothetical protein
MYKQYDSSLTDRPLPDTLMYVRHRKKADDRATTWKGGDVKHQLIAAPTVFRSLTAVPPFGPVPAQAASPADGEAPSPS